MRKESVRYRSVEVERALGVTNRILQWWDEHNVVSPGQQRHAREYTHEEAMLVGVVARLRKCGFSLQLIRQSLRAIERILSAHHPRFLIVGANAKRVDWASNDTDALAVFVRLSQAGIPALLIDAQEISDRLIEKSGTRPHLPARTYAVRQEGGAL